jgi:hypothetical protein
MIRIWENLDEKETLKDTVNAMKRCCTRTYNSCFVPYDTVNNAVRFCVSRILA